MAHHFTPFPTPFLLSLSNRPHNEKGHVNHLIVRPEPVEGPKSPKTSPLPQGEGESLDTPIRSSRACRRTSQTLPSFPRKRESTPGPRLVDLTPLTPKTQRAPGRPEGHTRSPRLLALCPD